MSQRYTISFSGRVQGVGFRMTTRSIARDFAVTGWVRNETDGTVRCVAEGEAAEIDRFVAAIGQRMDRKIENITTDKSDATGEFEGFTIRR